MPGQTIVPVEVTTSVSALSGREAWRPQSGGVGTGRRPPEAARRRPPGTEHGSRREETHRREHVRKPERPPPGFPTGRYSQAAALS